MSRNTGGRSDSRTRLFFPDMSTETPTVREVHLVVGFDGSPPAVRALDTAARLLSVRPPGRITVVWVAHLSGEVSLSAAAVALVENDFDQVAQALRAAAAELLAAPGLPGDIRWRAGMTDRQL